MRLISDIIGTLTVSEAVTYFEHDTYQSPTEGGPDFVVVDSANDILEAQDNSSARTAMGDSSNVTASSGTLTVEESATIQGLSFFNATESSYDVVDESSIIATAGDTALNIDGVDTVTSSDVANAADGAALNAMTKAVTFNVNDNGNDLFTAVDNGGLYDEAGYVKISDAENEIDVTSQIQNAVQSVYDDFVIDLTNYAALQVENQSLVLSNINDLAGTNDGDFGAVTDAVASIEALNAIIEGGSGNIAAAISDVRAKVDATPDDVILGGAGFGLVVCRW